MKTFQMVLLFCSVSFLAVCRAETSSPPKVQVPKPEKPTVQAPEKPVVPTPEAPLDHTVNVAVPPSSKNSQKIENLKAAIRKDPKKIDLIQQLAEELYKIDETEKTTALLWKYVEKIDRSGLILLVQAHEKRNEPDQMIKALNILTAKDPKDFEAFYLLGNAYFLKSKTRETVENYKTSIELNAKYEPPYLGLVKYYEKRDNFYELRMLYQDMVEHIGKRPKYFSKLCEINLKDGTFEAAIAQCKEAQLKEPENADNFVNLGLSYRGTGDTEVALKSLKEAAAKFPKSEYAQYTYGKSLEEQKNYVDALAYYKAATSADEKSSRAWLGLAVSSFELQKFEPAWSAFKTACKLDRKVAPLFRKAATQLNGSKNLEWSKKFADSAEGCTYSN